MRILGKENSRWRKWVIAKDTRIAHVYRLYIIVHSALKLLAIPFVIGCLISLRSEQAPKWIIPITTIWVIWYSLLDPVSVTICCTEREYRIMTKIKAPFISTMHMTFAESDIDGRDMQAEITIRRNGYDSSLEEAIQSALDASAEIASDGYILRSVHVNRVSSTTHLEPQRFSWNVEGIQVEG